MAKSKRINTQQLFTDIAGFIEESKQYVAQTVNTALPLLYFRIGNRINKEVLQNKRAEYGKQIVATLSQQLVEKYGKGWDEKMIRHCLRSAETFSEELILSAVRRQLGWTHLRTIMYLKDDLQRQFYIEMAEGNKEQIELLQLDKAGIKIAEYLTELPSKKLLQQKLHQAVEISKKYIESNVENLNRSDTQNKIRKYDSI